VKIGTDTYGMAERYMARWGYAVARRPVFGANIPAYLVGTLFGELRVEGLYTTDNLAAAYATPSAGELTIKTVTIEETDTQGTPVKKTWTFTGRISPFEKEGQADQFSIFRFTVELNAEPSVA